MSSMSIVVPTYNEQENISTTINKLDRFISKIFKTYEIIAVDSNSTDKTPEIIAKLSKKLKNVRVINQAKRRGFGNGLREGYSHCRYELVWYMDADCPYELDYLKHALPLIKNADAVIGYKIGKRESFQRWLFSKVYNWMVKLLFRLSYRDINFSFKLIKRDALRKLDLKSDKWFIDTEILCELKRHGMDVKEIPIKYIFREKGNSKVVIGAGIVTEMLKEMVGYMFRKKC